MPREHRVFHIFQQTGHPKCDAETVAIPSNTIIALIRTKKTADSAGLVLAKYADNWNSRYQQGAGYLAEQGTNGERIGRDEAVPDPITKQTQFARSGKLMERLEFNLLFR